MDKLYNFRAEYGLGKLLEGDAAKSPVEQFTTWFHETLTAEIAEPNAMVLSTVGNDMMPSARIVLLKKYDESGFTFFTNYNSQKAREIEDNSKACLLFPWHEIERQIKIQGIVEKVSDEESDEYFNSRPPNSRIGAWASPQSEVIPSREHLEKMENELREQFNPDSIPRPPHWGGYRLVPTMFEFWQGRQSRLHDRLRYEKEGEQWTISRLAP